MAPLPWGILASSGGGLTVTATNATLTSDADYYYLTYTVASGGKNGSLSVENGQVPIDYLLVGGGGGSSGISMVSSFSYNWAYSEFYGAQTVYVYQLGGSGAGGVLTGNTSLNPGNYSISVGEKGLGSLDGYYSNPKKGGNSTAFGLTAFGGGPYIVGTSASASARSGGSGGPGGSGVAGQGNAGAAGDFSGLTGNPPQLNAARNCQQWASSGDWYYNQVSYCYESVGTGGGPLGSGKGAGISSPRAFNTAGIGSFWGWTAPSSLGPITALGLTVAYPGYSGDIFGPTESPAENTGSGASTTNNSDQRARHGVIRVRIAKSTMAEVKVAA